MGKAPRFSLGINTCFAVKRWPQPEEWAPLVANTLGIDLVQHSLDLVDLQARGAEAAEIAERVGAACAAYGLRINSTFTGLSAYSSNLLLDPDPGARARAVDWFERAIEFTARIGARHAGGHLGCLSVRDHADPSRAAIRMADLHVSLRHLSATASRAGLVSLLVENMACEREPSRMDDIADLLADEDEAHVGIDLCLDVGHQCVPGTAGDERDPYAWLSRFGGATPVVHLQQTDAEADHHWPFTARFNALGRIDAARVLDTLAAAGAGDTALILEVIHPFETDHREVIDDLVESVAHWRAAINEYAEYRR